MIDAVPPVRQERADAPAAEPRPVAQLWLTHDPAEQEQMLLTAFEHGITYFDLADNYGPPYGEAERTFGRILKKDLCRTATS